ncbi:MAG: protease HtpX [Bdellovibrionales bacterium]|nr:protease HtpX [Bdellovibrionales bacterium]
MFKGLGKGILLLIVTNVLVMAMASIVMTILSQMGLVPDGYLGGTAVSCLVWGFGFAFLSLMLSKVSAKWMTGAQVIDPSNAGQWGWLVNMVHQQAKAANLPKMPEVAIYESPEVNAFATGPSRSNSMVAFSTGLLSGMNRDEIEGVSAHEITHIQNGDMLAMTLLQGLANAFVFFFSRIIARLAAERMDSAGARMAVYMIVNIVAQIVFMLLASLVLAWFSRKREFRADKGSAMIAGKQKMIAALEAIGRLSGRKIPDDARVPEAVSALAINNERKSWLATVAATHPPLQERIAALQAL